jgi:chaperonin GroES
MKWPVLTIACMQFNARMLPAVVKGDEAVNCKVIGQDNGKPKMGQNPQSGEIQPVPLMGPDGQPALDPSGMPQMDWIVPPGGKAKRARRVADYLNTTLFYRMENWEDDTDALLMQLPAVGCVFRKNWVDANGQPQTATVSALNLVVPQKARNLDTALRITERIEDVYPYEIRERMRSGFYRDAPAALGVQTEPGQGHRLHRAERRGTATARAALPVGLRRGRDRGAVHRHGRPPDAGGSADRAVVRPRRHQVAR